MSMQKKGRNKKPIHSFEELHRVMDMRHGVQ